MDENPAIEWLADKEEEEASEDKNEEEECKEEEEAVEVESNVHGL